MMKQIESGSFFTTGETSFSISSKLYIYGNNWKGSFS